MGTTITSTAGNVITGYTNVRANQALNPNLVASTTNWSFWQGTGGAGTTERVATTGPNGVGFIRNTWTTAATIRTGGVIYAGTPVIPNRVYTFSMWVRVPLQSTFVVPQIQFYNGTTATGNGAGATFTVPQETWTRISLTATSGPNDTKVDFRGYATDANSTAFTVGKILDAADVLIEWEPSLGKYFHGNTPPSGELSYAWSGTPNASSSLERLPIYAGIRTTAPALVNGYSSTRRSRNRVHDIIGTSYPVVTLAPPAPRTGTLELLYTSEVAAANAETLHAQGGKFTIADSDRPSIAMSYVLGGNLSRELDAETRDLWTVRVDYQEVAA